jgi:hypothetical protein
MVAIATVVNNVILPTACTSQYFHPNLFIGGLFNGAVNRPQRRMVGWILESQLERIVRNAVVGRFKILSRHIFWETEECHEGYRTRYPAWFEPRNSWMWILTRLIFGFSKAGIATGYGLDGWGWIPGRGKRFYLLYSVQTGSGAHPASYPRGTEGCFPGGKVAGAWSSSLTSIWRRGKKLWSYTSTPHIS